MELHQSGHLWNWGLLRKTTSGNANVTIQGLDGESSKPIYVKIDSEANANKININIPETNNRPIVIIYTGTTKNGKEMEKGIINLLF